MYSRQKFLTRSSVPPPSSGILTVDDRINAVEEEAANLAFEIIHQSLDDQCHLINISKLLQELKDLYTQWHFLMEEKYDMGNRMYIVSPFSTSIFVGYLNKFKWNAEMWCSAVKEVTDIFREMLTSIQLSLLESSVYVFNDGKPNSKDWIWESFLTVTDPEYIEDGFPSLVSPTWGYYPHDLSSVDFSTLEDRLCVLVTKKLYPPWMEEFIREKNLSQQEEEEIFKYTVLNALGSRSLGQYETELVNELKRQIKKKVLLLDH